MTHAIERILYAHGKYRLRRKALAIVLFFAIVFTPLVGWSYPDWQYTSWYGPGLWGNTTASGEVLYYGSWSAASNYYPFGTELTICHKHVCAYNVRVTDRGPATWTGRELDLEQSVAEHLGMTYQGVGWTKVYVE